MVYDQLDRLTSTTSPMFGTASYVYDTLDNLKQVNVSGGTGARNHYYCYNAANQLEFVRSGSNCTSSPSVINISYDVQGNLLQKTGTTGGTYTFDYGNRLRTVVAPSAPTTTYNYRYDADGRREKIIDDHGHPAVVTGIGRNHAGKAFAYCLRLDKQGGRNDCRQNPGELS